MTVTPSDQDPWLYNVTDIYGREILMLGDLRKLLERHSSLPDDTHIVMGDKDGWYDNIVAVAFPSLNYEESDWSAITFMPGDQIDSRQF